MPSDRRLPKLTRAILFSLGLAVSFASLWLYLNRAGKVPADSRDQGPQAPLPLVDDTFLAEDSSVPQPNASHADASWIRLCRLVDAPDGGIALSLQNFLLPTAPPYRALSYTWGPANSSTGGGDEDLAATMSNETGTWRQPLRENLFHALSQLRDFKEDGFLWIDALCINQSDTSERNEQVRIMDKIYGRATAVDVWLGTSNEHTPKLQRILEELRNWCVKCQPGTQGEEDVMAMRQKVFVDNLTKDEWETFGAFFSLRWHWRIWTLQELALARDLRFLWGQYTIDFASLQIATTYLWMSGVPMESPYGKTETAGEVMWQRFFLRQILNSQELAAAIFDLHSGSMTYEDILLFVYWRSTSSFATDERDHVYGILGIVNAIAERVLAGTNQTVGGKPNFQPVLIDYTLSFTEVSRSFVELLMQSRLGIRAITISQPDRKIKFRDARSRCNTSLPSWVPNLADRHLEHHSLSWNGVFHYHEGELLHPRSVFPRMRIPQSAVVWNDELHVFGRRVGVILDVSRHFPRKTNVQDRSLCTDLALSLSSLLANLGQRHFGSNLTVLESLETTLRMERAPSTVSRFERSSPVAQTKDFFESAMRFLLFDQLRNGNSTVGSEPKCSTFLLHVYNLLANDTRNESTEGTCPTRKSFPWQFFNNTLYESGRQLFLESCQNLVRRYREARGQRVVTVKLNDYWSIDSKYAVLLGLASGVVEAGDEIWAVVGTEWPFVLRRRYTDEASPQTIRTRSQMSKSDGWIPGRHPTATVFGTVHQPFVDLREQYCGIECRSGRPNDTRQERLSSGNLRVPVYEYLGEAYVHGIMDGLLWLCRVEATLEEIALR